MAALVAALTLRDLAGERIALTLIAPNPDFAYQPMAVEALLALRCHGHPGFALRARRD